MNFTRTDSAQFVTNSTGAAFLVAFIGTLPASIAAAADRLALEEILVTAQKIEQNLQDVPIAVSVWSGNFVSQKLIEGIDDLLVRIPGFAMNAPFKSQVQPAMRGATSLEDSPGADQGVTMFIDEVYIGHTATFDFHLFDIERVEILRGPQGTVFGRNVVGGAISVITRDPPDVPRVDIGVRYGRFDELGVDASVGGPLTESLMGLLSVSTRDSDGYVDNQTSGNELVQEELRSVRGKVKFDQGDALSAVLTLEYSTDESFGIDRNLVGTPVPFVPQTSDENVNFLNRDGSYDRETFGSALRIEYEADDYTFTSLTSYRDHEDSFDADADGTPEVILELDPTRNDIEQFSQELRIAGDGERLDWLLGAYYLNVQHLRLEELIAAGGPGSFLEEIFGGLRFRERFGQNLETESIAAFAQGTYALTDSLQLTLGGRFTRDEKSGETICVIIETAGLNCGQDYVAPISGDWSAFTPRVALDWHATDTAMLYASASRGFKSGGFASGFATPESAQVPFDPEYAWSYELGLKSRWLEDRLQANVAAFFVDYTDLQVRQFDPVNPALVIVGNAGESSVEGIEVEISARPANWLELWANYTYQDGEYDQLVLEGEDLSGNTLPLTPRNSLTAGFDAVWSSGNALTWTLSADVLTKSEYFLDVANDPGQTSEFDSIVNAGLELEFGTWAISLWGKNLSDERQALQKANFSAFYHPTNEFFAGATTYATRLNAPRTYGVSIRWSL